MRTHLANAGRVAAATLALAALVATTAIVNTEIAGAADAARRAPRATHLGVPVENFVVLALVDPLGTPKFVRVNSDGTSETSEFTVPDGHALVVTDVDHVRFGGNQSATCVRVFVKNAATGVKSLVFADATAELTNSANHGRSSSALTGFAVSPGTTIVADIIDLQLLSQASPKPFTDVRTRILLRGYLTPTR